MKGFDNFDEAYSNRTDDEGLPLSTRPLLRRKPHRERLIFWGANAVGMPLVALFALSLGAEGLKRTVGGFALKLYKLPIPGASRLEQYDGFARIDLAMVFALVLFVAVTFIWYRAFLELMGHGTLLEQRTTNPVLFFLLSGVAGVVVLGDCAMFYVGLASKTAGGWGATPFWVPAVATLLYLAGIALIGALHADYRTSGAV